MTKVLLRNKLYTKGSVTSSGGGGSGIVETIIPGTNITIDNTDPANPVISTTADDITVVANYSALPAANTVSGEFYWCSNSQGTSWLPGSLGGTYYSAGLYYSNGTTWEYLATPYQATQAEVNTGTNDNKFVTPSTLNNYSGWASSKVGLGNVENTALSTWAGSTNITTLGTIATGAIPASKITAGTFGTGAYVMSTSLSTPSLIGTSGQLAFTSTAQSSGAIIDYLFTPSNHTGQTASTNTPVFRIASATKTFEKGALTAWYANHLQTQTIAFAGASIVTDAFGTYFESATAGTNATITNNYSLGTSGFVKFGSGLSGLIIRNDVSTNNYVGLYNASPTPSSTNYFIKSNGTTTLVNATGSGVLYLAYSGTAVLSISSTSAMTIAEGVTTNAGTTTGWKIGGSTAQKLSFWNKTPIVQPTTGITAAAFVANTSGTVNDTATFGGYTIGQIAAALINTGILA